MVDLTELKSKLTKDIDNNSYDFEGTKWIRAETIKTLITKRIKNLYK